MKKTVIFALFFGFFALITPRTSLFADIGFGGRFDAGLNLLAFPMSSVPIDEDVSIMPVFPLIDLGGYSQFKFGALNLGVGLRGISVILVNVFWPSFYTELNLWRFTVNAQIGGGAIFLFPIYLLAGPYFVPEVSVWYTITEFNKGNYLKLGIGALSLFSSRTVKEEFISDFANNVVFYISVKAALDFPWITWKRES